MKQSEDRFCYLAFDEDAGTLLAHGTTAVAALDHADRLAPNAAICVIDASENGEVVWNQQMALTAARQITSCSGQHSSILKPLQLPPIQATWTYPTSVETTGELMTIE